MYITVFHENDSCIGVGIIAVAKVEDKEAALLDILHGRIASAWNGDNPPTFNNLDACLEYCEDNGIDVPQEETLVLFQP